MMLFSLFLYLMNRNNQLIKLKPGCEANLGHTVLFTLLPVIIPPDSKLKETKHDLTGEDPV